MQEIPLHTALGLTCYLVIHPPHLPSQEIPLHTVMRITYDGWNPPREVRIYDSFECVRVYVNVAPTTINARLQPPMRARRQPYARSPKEYTMHKRCLLPYCERNIRLTIGVLYVI